MCDVSGARLSIWGLVTSGYAMISAQYSHRKLFLHIPRVQRISCLQPQSGFGQAPHTVPSALPSSFGFSPPSTLLLHTKWILFVMALLVHTQFNSLPQMQSSPYFSALLGQWLCFLWQGEFLLMIWFEFYFFNTASGQQHMLPLSLLTV